MKKFIQGLLIVFISLFLMACPKKSSFLVVNLNDIELFLLDNRFEHPTTTQVNNLPAKAFGLRLQLKYQINEESDWEEKSDFSINDAIDSISITSTADFDSTLVAGTDLIHNFSIFKNYKFHDVKEFMKGNRVADVMLSDGDKVYEAIDLLLMEPPNQIQIHEFTIRIILQDGQVFEQTASPIKLSL